MVEKGLDFDFVFFVLCEFGLVFCGWCIKIDFIMIGEQKQGYGGYGFGVGLDIDQCVFLLGVGFGVVEMIVLQVYDKFVIYCDCY